MKEISEIKELKYLRDNWVIVITLFLILSTLSLDLTYSFYGFEIFNYVDIQEGVLIFFKSFLNLNSVFVSIFCFILIYSSYAFDENENKLDHIKFLTPFLIFRVLVYGVCSAYIFIGYPEISDERFLKMLDLVYKPLIASLSINIGLSFIGQEFNQNRYSNIIKSLVLVYYVSLTLVFHNIRIIEQNIFFEQIYHLDKADIRTNFQKFVIFQSKSIVVFYDSVDKSTLVIPISEVNSIEDCNSI